MENTLENKAKFFAQYWGQRVMAVTVNEDNTRHKIGNSHMGKYHVECCHLELKPLSSITDEDVQNLEWSDIDYFKKYYNSKKDKGCLFAVDIDGLRQLGFATSWNGLSVRKLLEYGWIKIKSE